MNALQDVLIRCTAGKPNNSIEKAISIAHLSAFRAIAESAANELYILLKENAQLKEGIKEAVDIISDYQERLGGEGIRGIHIDYWLERWGE